MHPKHAQATSTEDEELRLQLQVSILSAEHLQPPLHKICDPFLAINSIFFTFIHALPNLYTYIAGWTCRRTGVSRFLFQSRIMMVKKKMAQLMNHLLFMELAAVEGPGRVERAKQLGLH